MPTCARQRCSAPGCDTLVSHGRCDTHRSAHTRERRERNGFDYSAAWWRRFRLQFIAMLVDAGITPVCGATLPGGPTVRASQCQHAQVLIGASLDGSSLHLHHEPALSSLELAALVRGAHAAACDPLRIVLLCRECHSRETHTQAGGR